MTTDIIKIEMRVEYVEYQYPGAPERGFRYLAKVRFDLPLNAPGLFKCGDCGSVFDALTDPRECPHGDSKVPR